MPKRRSRRRHSHKPHPRKPLFVGLLILFACVFVLAGFWFLAKLGPQDVDYRELNGGTEISEEVAAAREESSALQDETFPPGGDNEHEEDGAGYPEAEAAGGQAEMSEQVTPSIGDDIQRATRLEREARYLEAEPVFKRSLELENEAEKLIEGGKSQDAEAKLREAIQLQDRLNRDFAGSSQARVARLERLRGKLDGIRSAQDYLEIEAITARADRLWAEGQHLEAGDLYFRAARLQRALNEAYRDTPYASPELVAEYMRKAETAESYELGLSIENKDRILKEVLADRRTFEAAKIIVDLRQSMKRLRETYPRSSLNNEGMQLKIRFLNLVQDDLEFIQNQVYKSLLPIPGEKEWKIFRSETTQALYSLIMGDNPSRNVGDTKPVDSVSWIEAKRFCQRLSWILGKSVRLPTENEFRQSVGQPRYVELAKQVWNASDTDGQPQPVAQKAPFESGCYDLLGNVSEWIESVDRSETKEVRHIGGHAQDSLETLFTVPLREAGRGERNRLIGFRFAVLPD